jgi:hypothetical protein
MALPTLNTQYTYETIIPSTKKVIRFRPFLVGEEKLFLMAAEAGTPKAMFDAVRRVLEACVTTEGFETQSLTAYDIEFLFLQLRARSVGEQEPLMLTCKECEGKNKIDFDFEKSVYVRGLDTFEPTKRIDLGGNIHISLVMPGVDEMMAVQETKDQTELVFKLIDLVIDKVYTEEEVMTFSAESKADRAAFVNSMSQAQLGEIQEFISGQPQIAADLSYTCGHCQAENQVVLTGLQDFFG